MEEDPSVLLTYTHINSDIKVKLKISAICFPQLLSLPHGLWSNFEESVFVCSALACIH